MLNEELLKLQKELRKELKVSNNEELQHRFALWDFAEGEEEKAYRLDNVDATLRHSPEEKTMPDFIQTMSRQKLWEISRDPNATLAQKADAAVAYAQRYGNDRQVYLAAGLSEEQVARIFENTAEEDDLKETTMNPADNTEVPFYDERSGRLSSAVGEAYLKAVDYHAQGVQLTPEEDEKIKANTARVYSLTDEEAYRERSEAMEKELEENRSQVRSVLSMLGFSSREAQQHIIHLERDAMNQRYYQLFTGFAK